jgi:hypothetical protein
MSWLEKITLLVVLYLTVVNARTFQKGMAFGGDVPSIPYDSPAAVQSLTNLKATGADWVCITLSWFQENINSTSIYAVEGRSPTIPSIISIVNNATALGFKVVLKPHVDVLDGTWRAWVGTYFTEDDWAKWFTSYYAYYLTFAKIAQQVGVAVYSVGVEMVTASANSAQFIELVKQVRGYYSGTVTYSANWGTKLQSVLPPSDQASTMPMAWGGEIDTINWINTLDIIGLDAYYYLTNEQNPSLNDLLLAWNPIVLHIRNISHFWNKTVMFTEIGYRSIQGASIHPGWWNNSATVNITQQAVCYEAVFQSFINENWWEGIHWWAWSSDPKAGGPQDTDFTPQNKLPTITVLQKYYSLLGESQNEN